MAVPERMLTRELRRHACSPTTASPAQSSGSPKGALVTDTSFRQ